jgi:hypothetical protein
MTHSTRAPSESIAPPGKPCAQDDAPASRPPPPPSSRSPRKVGGSTPPPKPAWSRRPPGRPHDALDFGPPLACPSIVPPSLDALVQNPGFEPEPEPEAVRESMVSIPPAPAPDLIRANGGMFIGTGAVALGAIVVALLTHDAPAAQATASAAPADVQANRAETEHAPSRVSGSAEARTSSGGVLVELPPRERSPSLGAGDQRHQERSSPEPEPAIAAEPGILPEAGVDGVREPAAPPFDRTRAAAALKSSASAASGCGSGEERVRTRVAVTFAPSGRATVALLEGDSPLRGTTAGSCVARLLSSTTIPPFSGAAITVRLSVTTAAPTKG